MAAVIWLGLVLAAGTVYFLRGTDSAAVTILAAFLIAAFVMASAAVIAFDHVLVGSDEPGCTCGCDAIDTEDEDWIAPHAAWIDQHEVDRRFDQIIDAEWKADAA